MNWREIQRQRKVRQWTLKTLAERSGLSVSYISDIEHGRTTPSFETLDKLATAFDMSANELFGVVALKLVPKEQAVIDAIRDGDLRRALSAVLDAFADS